MVTPLQGAPVTRYEIQYLVLGENHPGLGMMQGGGRQGDANTNGNAKANRNVSEKNGDTGSSIECFTGKAHMKSSRTCAGSVNARNRGGGDAQTDASYYIDEYEEHTSTLPGTLSPSQRQIHSSGRLKHRN